MKTPQQLKELIENKEAITKKELRTYLDQMTDLAIREID